MTDVCATNINQNKSYTQCTLQKYDEKKKERQKKEKKEKKKKRSF
jgi:hypothetical protein